MRKSLITGILFGGIALWFVATLAQVEDSPELTIAVATIQRLHPSVAGSNFDSRVIKSVVEGLLNQGWLNSPNGNDGTAIVPSIITAWEPNSFYCMGFCAESENAYFDV